MKTINVTKWDCKKVSLVETKVDLEGGETEQTVSELINTLLDSPVVVKVEYNNNTFFGKFPVEDF